jgi:hypothetical protein
MRFTSLPHTTRGEWYVGFEGFPDALWRVSIIGHERSQSTDRQSDRVVPHDRTDVASDRRSRPGSRAGVAQRSRVAGSVFTTGMGTRGVGEMARKVSAALSG